MIISHKYKFVFIHIPKTGGSYIKNILRTLDNECLYIDYYKNINLYGHLPFFLIKQLDIYEDIKNYTFFTVIRDPIDLILSHYNYILTIKENHYLYSTIKDKTLCESMEFLLLNNPELHIRFIKNDYYNSDEFNEIDIYYTENYTDDKSIKFLKKTDNEDISINTKIHLLDFSKLSKELENFFRNIVNVPENIIESINFDTKVNVSNKYINYDDINNINIQNLSNYTKFKKNMSLYLSLKKV